MYEPCWECKNRYGREYSKECDESCGYAAEVKSLKDRIKQLDCDCAKAHEFIGRLLEKPNPFDADASNISVLAPGLDRIFISAADGIRVRDLMECCGVSESEIISRALKHYDDLVRIADLMADIPN